MIESFTIKIIDVIVKGQNCRLLHQKRRWKNSDLPPVWFKEINGKRILRMLLCVGLNGTGKSKMFSALNYLRMLAIAKPQSLRRSLNIVHSC